jgi:hypothetical protein
MSVAPLKEEEENDILKRRRDAQWRRQFRN